VIQWLKSFSQPKDTRFDPFLQKQKKKKKQKFMDEINEKNSLYAISSS